ncbi:MAG TPA: ABC transporter permease [Bacillota bacterium]|nr:ABC transporter permease [Bacillota bacterium]
MALSNKIKLNQIVPFFGLAFLLIIFSLIIGGKFWTGENMLAIFNQTVLIMMGGLGMIFVVAQGSVDISQGSSLALIAMITGIAANKFGVMAVLPTVILTGAAVGLFNGLVVSKLRVPSLTCTLATLIAFRALVAVISGGDVIYIPAEMLSFSDFGIMFPVFIALVLIVGYLFEYTRVGYYSKAIGENEVKAQYTGVPVIPMKVVAFVLSGIMAGIAGVFTLSRIGGADPNMGNFFELEVLLALFAGGISVSGGMSTRIYRLFIGAITIGVLVNGLSLCNVSADIAEGVKGLILILVVFLALNFASKRGKKESLA